MNTVRPDSRTSRPGRRRALGRNLRADPPAHRRAGRGPTAAEVHHVEIVDAKLHYHAKTDEFYYVIDGQGTMILDDEVIELHKGVVVYVPRGVKHKAVGKLTGP